MPRRRSRILTLFNYWQIKLRVEINEKEGSAHLDFEGTGCEVRGNLNAPISVVHSAVIYSMRAMLDMDIPLNAGCLVPLTSALSLCFRAWFALTVDLQSTFRVGRCCRPRRQRLCAAGTFSRHSASSMLC